VQAELVSQAAKREGILTTDAEVRDYIIKDIPVFQQDGRFQRDRYLGYLEATRTKASDFEGRVRKDIANVRTRHLVELSARPLSMEVGKVKELQDRKLNVAFARVDANDVSKSMKVPAAEITAKLADAEFLKRAEDYFKAYKAEWSTQESAKAQHILIGYKPGDAASEAKALEKIKEIEARTKKEDFGKLASQLSEDPGSKAKNGQLDSFTRGKMVKEFEDAAFSQKIGEVGPPVKSQFGYHLIKVNQRTEAKEPTFEEVKMDVASRLHARDRAEAEFKSLDEAVASGSQEKVDEILKKLGVNWEETGYFDLASDAVPRVPAGAVADAVFEVSEQKPLLNRVVREEGARYILKLKGMKIEAAKDAPVVASDALQRRRADGIYGSWLNLYRQRSRVEMNQEVLRQ
jgi:peptidyl-prolyl cis-trans isomerase D